MDAVLDFICPQARRARVVDDDVVRGSNGALQPRVRLQIEREFEDGWDAAVDDGARSRVPVLVRVRLCCRGEARVVALAADDDGELGALPLRCHAYTM